MKSLNQIKRYTSHCRFPDEDWQKVLAFCRERFRGGKIHKCQKPISDSTYEKFLEWIDDGFGSGDMISYGNTSGIIVSSTPQTTIITAYRDFDDNLMRGEMVIRDEKRLKRLDEEESRKLRKRLIKNGLEYSLQSHGLVPLCTLKENLYVVIGNDEYGTADVGLYLESDGCKHKFAGLVKDGELMLDCWIDTDYTPLRKASDDAIHRFHRAVSKAGLTYNARYKKFVEQPRVGTNNCYYYLSDRFDIVTERDNGKSVHAQRFAAGNYFLNQAEALEFAVLVRKLREEGHC